MRMNFAPFMSLPFGFEVRAALRCEPLPVGETGVSKCKGEDREGDHPFCTTEGRKNGDTRFEVRQSARTLARARGSAP